MTAKANVLPTNSKAKDRLFNKIYESEANLKDLASFLLGRDVEQIKISNVEPVLFGNKENDLAFMCDDSLYVMMEEQSYYCANIAYRILEYIVAGLRTTVESENLLYGSHLVTFPTPKLYVVNVGLVKSPTDLKGVLYDIKLSDSYIKSKYVDSLKNGVDLEVVVHAYDFRMSFHEALAYIENNTIPERIKKYNNTLLSYALTANSLTYVQRVLNDPKNKLQLPKNIHSTADMIELLKDRNIFVELFSDKGVCDMTMAQFSRDDILIYRGREEGREEGRMEGRMEEKYNSAIHTAQKDYKRGKYSNDEIISDIAVTLQIDTSEAQQIFEREVVAEAVVI